MPYWLQILAYVYLASAFLCAILVLVDIFVLGNGQKMTIMNIVWPVTCLYYGIAGLAVYIKIGRITVKTVKRKVERPFYQKVFISASHCGAGCTLGDIIGEQIVLAASLAISGIALFASFALDFALAYILGIAFQYAAIKPMHANWSRRKALIGAIKADTLSLTAFEVGLFGWMALMRFVFFDPPLHPNDPVFWFMMQIGMIVGFATTYPANWFLVKNGIKEAM